MDLRQRQRLNTHALNIRRDARPQAMSAQHNGQGVTLNGNPLRAQMVSNGPMGNGEGVVLSGDSGLVQQELRRVRRGESVGRAASTKDGILILIEHYSSVTEKWTYSLGGDRPVQQIYEHPVRLQAVINPVLEVGKTKNSWAFHGVIVTQNLPYIYKIKVVTVTAEGTVLSPEINAWSAYQSIHYLGSGAWNINIAPYPYTINTAVPNGIRALDPPRQEQIESVGDLFSGQIQPTDPFRRIATGTGSAPRLNTNYVVVPLSEATQASGVSLGAVGSFVNKKTTTIATTVDCGLGVELIEIDNTATCNIISIYVKGTTVEQSVGVSNTFYKYRSRKERDPFCASGTLAYSDQDYLDSVTISIGPTSLIYLTQELKIDYQWSMKFSDSYPAAQRSGERSSIYNGVTNTEVAYTKFNWDFPVATFNSGSAYLGYKATLDIPEIRQVLAGTVMPIPIPTPSSDPNSTKFFFEGNLIEPTFPSNPANIPPGNPYDFNDFFLRGAFDGAAFRDLKNWRIEAGELQIDKISELPRVPNTSAVSLDKSRILTDTNQAVYSYKLLANGTFEKIREKRVPVIPVELQGARLINALYYSG